MLENTSDPLALSICLICLAFQNSSAYGRPKGSWTGVRKQQQNRLLELNVWVKLCGLNLWTPPQEPFATNVLLPSSLSLQSWPVQDASHWTAESNRMGLGSLGNSAALFERLWRPLGLVILSIWPSSFSTSVAFNVCDDRIAALICLSLSLSLWETEQRLYLAVDLYVLTDWLG